MDGEIDECFVIYEVVRKYGDEKGTKEERDIIDIVSLMCMCCMAIGEFGL